jgi:hypothetical protein
MAGTARRAPKAQPTTDEVVSKAPNTTKGEKQSTKRESRVSKIKSKREIERARQDRMGRPVTFFLKDFDKGIRPPEFLFKAQHYVNIPYNWKEIPEIKSYLEENDILEHENGTKDYLVGEQVMRYIKGQRSLFMANQGDGAVLKDPIIFKHGSLILNDRKDKSLIKLLRMSNMNSGNPMRDTSVAPEFYEFKPNEKAEKEKAFAANVVKANQMIVDSDVEDLFSVAHVLGVTLASDSEIQAALAMMAIRNPKAIIDAMNDPFKTEKDTALMAKELGIIDTNSKTIYYMTPKRNIVTIPSGRDWLSFFSEWMSRDEEGHLVFEELERRIDA